MAHSAPQILVLTMLGFVAMVLPSHGTRLGRCRVGVGGATVVLGLGMLFL